MFPTRRIADDLQRFVPDGPGLYDELPLGELPHRAEATGAGLAEEPGEVSPGYVAESLHSIAALIAARERIDAEEVSQGELAVIA